MSKGKGIVVFAGHHETVAAAVMSAIRWLHLERWVCDACAQQGLGDALLWTAAGTPVCPHCRENVRVLAGEA